ncbi:ATP synthase F0 subunit C [Candidatus Babeliales bacterium]|nr:ATP synthase F0 subunit C [Candidatus Babeliales bacterium]
MVEGIFYAKAAAYMGAAFAVGFGCLGPALGQGMIGSKACESIGKNPEGADKVRAAMMIALIAVESSAIYALVVSFFILILSK